MVAERDRTYLDRSTWGSKGEHHRRAKLTTAQVLEIRELYAAGGRGRELGARFGISRQTFDGIGARRRWQSIE